MQHEVIFKNDTITLSKGVDGFWLYDKSRGMNLSMRATTEQEAFIQALTYYQKRLKEVESMYRSLEVKINNISEIINEVEL